MMETETNASYATGEMETAGLKPGQDRKSKMIVVFLWLVLSTLAALPFFFMGDPPFGTNGFRLQMPVTHDMHLHYWQMRSFFDGLASGEIYPSWEEDTNRGFGAPTSSYYPPVIYYLTSAFYWLAGDWMWSLLILHLLMMLASGAAIYFYARSFMNRFAATVAMAAYIFSPYHLVDQYQRAAMAELLGFIWMPLILLFGGRMIRDRFDSRDRPRRLLNISGLAVTVAAFLWSHPPTAYQFMLAFGVFVALLAWMRRDFIGLIAIIAALLLGLALSAAYLYPAFVEKDFISHDYIAETWPYHGSYVFVHALPYAEGHRGFFNLIDGIWVFGAVSLMVSALVLLARKRPPMDARLREAAILWTAIGIFASFMMSSVSYPVGRLIPQIEIGVFTWRMLSITALAVALLAGACAEAARNALGDRQRFGRVSFASLAVFITFGSVVFSVAGVWGPMYRAMAFVPVPEHINYAMLPTGAPTDPLELPVVEPAELVEGKGRVEVKRWDPEHRELEVVLDEADSLLIRTFYFPGWRAEVNGEPVPVIKGEALRVELNGSGEILIREATFDGRAARIIGKEMLGDIVLKLGPGAHNIKLDYLDTPPRRHGKLVTALSFLLLLAVAGFGWRKEKSGDKRGTA